MSMTITLNGNTMNVPDGFTLYDLVELKKWRLVPNYAKINGEIIKGNEYSKTALQDGQNVKIIPQFGGG